MDLVNDFESTFHNILKTLPRDSYRVGEIQKLFHNIDPHNPKWINIRAMDLGWRNSANRWVKYNRGQVATILTFGMMWNNEKYKRGDILPAAKIVYKNYENRDNQTLWRKKIEIGINRVDRVLIARTLGFVVSTLSHSDILPSDCLIVTVRGTASNNLKYDASVIDSEQLKTLLFPAIDTENPDSRTIEEIKYAITGEKGGIYYLVDNLLKGELSGRKYLKLQFPLPGKEYMALYIGPSLAHDDLLEKMKKQADLFFNNNIKSQPTGAPPSPAEEEASATKGKATDAYLKDIESHPLYQLLKTALFIWPEAALKLPFGAPDFITYSAAKPKDAPNTVLWVFTKLIQGVFLEEFGLSCFCDILALQREEAGKSELKILASSRDDAWNARIERGVTIPEGQFLSGAVLIADCGLVVKDFNGINSKLISRSEDEKKWVESTGNILMGAVAISTLNPSTATPNGSLYIGLHTKKGEAFTDNADRLETKEDNFADRVKLLEKQLFCIQALALFAGELIERENIASNTVRTGARLNKYRILEENEFREKIQEKLGTLISPEVDISLRIPMILFFAMPDKDSSLEMATWLSDQLPNLNIEGELRRFINGIGVSRDELVVGRISIPDVVGQIRKPAVLAIFIPQLVGKRELKLLREIPTERNSLVPLINKAGEIQMRISAWVLDFQISELKSNRDDNVKREEFIMNRIRGWASVAPNVVRAYKYMYQQAGGDTKLKADWSAARDEAIGGLGISSQNSYLLRRLAECLLILGSPNDAEKFAEQAFDADKKHVGGSCLLGDVLLSRAKVTEAIKQYKQAKADNPEHALPYYSAACAITTVSQIIRDHVIEKIKNSKGPLQIELLKKYIRQTDKLLENAGNLFNYSATRFQESDYEARADYRKVYYSLHNSFAKAEAILLSGNTENALIEFRGSRDKYPEDESIRRGLIRATLQRIGAKTLVNQLESTLKAVNEFL